MKRLTAAGIVLLAVSFIAPAALAKKPRVPFGFKSYYQYRKARTMMRGQVATALNKATHNNIHVSKPFTNRDIRLGRLRPSPLEIMLPRGRMWLDGKWKTKNGCFGGQCNFSVDTRDKLNVQLRPSGFKILMQPRSLPPRTLD